MPSSWLLHNTEVRAGQQFYCKAKAAFMNVKSQDSKDSKQRREPALESIYNTEQDRTRLGTEACGSPSGTCCTMKEMLILKHKD